MKRAEDTSRQAKRYIGLDVHKHYITVGGMNARQELVLRLRNVEMDRFKRWAEENLRPTDEVVLETTTNTWDIYDTVAPRVERVVVANPAEVKQIANARVKTDRVDVLTLAHLLRADMLPEVCGSNHRNGRSVRTTNLSPSGISTRATRDHKHRDRDLCVALGASEAGRS